MAVAEKLFEGTKRSTVDVWVWKIMSSGSACSGNHPVRSSSCRSRCSEGWGGRGRSRPERGVRACGCIGTGRGWCRGSGKCRHWGWTEGWGQGKGCSWAESWSPWTSPQPSPRADVGSLDCRWGWRPIQAVCGGGCAGRGAGQGPPEGQRSRAAGGVTGYSRGTAGRWGYNRHGSPSCCSWLLWNTPSGRPSCSAA